MTFSSPEGKIWVLYDGMCILCSGLVRFLLKADKKQQFVFSSLQGERAKEVLHHLADNEPDSVIVIRGNKMYCYSDAVYQIGMALGGIYKSIVIIRLIPRKWRDALYKWIAKNRFRWFGKRASCYLPSSEEEKRFI